MVEGFIRVGAAVPVLRVGDCIYNAQQTETLMRQAVSEKVQVLCFPELGLTGYTCGDLFHQQVLLEQAVQALDYLLEASRGMPLLTLVGMPLSVGNRLMNVAVVFQEGCLLAIVPKTWLPNYGEYYEKRWFSSASEVSVKEVNLLNQLVPFGTDIVLKNGNIGIGIELCEDLWMPIPPSSQHALQGANLLFNLSASNELVTKDLYRQQLIHQQSARCMAAYIYASSGFGESTTDVVFAGNASIVENGVSLAVSERFCLSNQLITADIDTERLNSDRRRNTGFTTGEAVSQPYREIPFMLTGWDESGCRRLFDRYPFVPSGSSLEERCYEVFSIQVFGLVKRLQHTGSRRAVLGISGGLDSTWALLVTVGAFDTLKIPMDQIEAVTMPGFGTTDRTYTNALQLMRQLGVHVREIPIVKAVNQHFEDIGHNPDRHDVTYENAQARERTQILMDIANQVNGLVIGTGDLSELALGWTTYNGDHMSMYGVNAGVPKTLVRSLITWYINKKSDPVVGAVLEDILATPVSPELLPVTAAGEMGQKTEELVGPYELHDFFLYYLLRFGFNPSKIAWMAFRAFEGVYDKATVLKWLTIFYRRFFSQQFKRSCLPDGPKIGSVSLSPRGDWRMPSDATSRLWLDDLEAMTNMD